MQFRSQVLANVELSPGYFRLRLTAPPELAATAVPGQFVMVRVREAIDPLLRRPFGIYDVLTLPAEFTGGSEQTALELLIKVVGKGTAMLSALQRGDQLDLLAPLGKGFSFGDAGEEKILVGGGIGLAPLYYLGKRLREAGHRVRLYLGGRTRDDILCVTEFERLGIETYVATDDGTLGEQGFVTQVLERHLAELAGPATLFACGPEPMLAAAARLAERFRLPCQVSLEAYMACGVGACLGCVVPGHGHADDKPDYRCVCKDGPVFAHDELKWA